MDLRHEIAQWFRNHDDGEFVIPSEAVAYSVNVPDSHARNVLYTTKQECAERLLGMRPEHSPARLIARYGLPQDNDFISLRDYVGGWRLCFLGDCDPVDLLVCASLRMSLECGLLE